MAKAKAKRQSVVIVGCGNVAWHLAKHLSETDQFNLFIYNHKANPVLKEFNGLPHCKTFPSLINITDSADYYLLAVSDDMIAKIETRVHVKKPGALIMHTSGSVELSALGERAHESAVFYPLQTFSRADAVKWKEIPIIIEADNEATRVRVREFALHFSNIIHFADYKKRLRVHLAAVLVNNFSNALFAAAAGLLDDKEEGMAGADLLKPLMRQTVKKLDRMSPLEAQTGPAKRNDVLVLEKHLQLLENKPELRKIYKHMSKLIQKQQKTYAKL